MMQAAHLVSQPPAFYQERLKAPVLHGRAELLICVLQPHTAQGDG